MVAPDSVRQLRRAVAIGLADKGDRDPKGDRDKLDSYRQQTQSDWMRERLLGPGDGADDVDQEEEVEVRARRRWLRRGRRRHTVGSKRRQLIVSKRCSAAALVSWRAPPPTRATSLVPSSAV